MSIRARTRAILAAGSALLGLVGIVVVGYPGPKNIALDCAPASGFCTALLEPADAQCPALHARIDPGGPSGRLLRALNALGEGGAIAGWTAHPRDGAPSSCWVEVRLSAWLTDGPDGGVRIDGQAPGWRDVVDAADLGSIIKSGPVSTRPAYAKRGGCRAHVYVGEDPCAVSDNLPDGGGSEDDGGP